MLKDPKVSVFKDFTVTSGGETYPLADIYESVKIPNDLVLKYRALPEATDGEKAFKQTQKESLPGLTGSGVFKGRRIAEKITEHNGRIVVDIDHVGNRFEMLALKQRLKEDEYVEAVYESVSGNGFAVYVKIDPKDHINSFQGLQKYFLDKYDKPIDKKCSDPSRFRFISYDPDIYVNWESKVFYPTKAHVNHVKRVTANIIVNAVRGTVHDALMRASRLMGGYIAGALISEDEAFDYLVELMREKPGVVSLDAEKKKIRDGINNGKKEPITGDLAYKSEEQVNEDRQRWREIYEWIHTVNRAGRPWAEADVTALCTQHLVAKEKVEYAFKKIYAEHKDEYGIDEKPDIVKVEVFLKRNYEFSRNIITQLIEFKPKDSNDYEELNEDTIYRKLQHVGFKYSLDKLRSLLKSDFVEEYNPFEVYFNKISTDDSTKWDGVTDHITALAGHVKTTDQQFFVNQFKKMLVRSVGCSLYGFENRYVFVFVQENQRTGKSSFIRFLNPFGKKYYTERPIGHDKDTNFSFSENFIYNMEELQSLNNFEVNRLKAVISAASIKERKAYERNAKEQPRRCNFWGSTNNDGFLVDSENSRWLCFRVEGSIDWRGYTKTIDIHKVWAQAFALYHAGFDAQLSDDEAGNQNRANKFYEVNDLEKELIKQCFEVAGRNECEFYSNADILKTISETWTGRNSLDSRFIGKLMKQLGFTSDLKRLNDHVVRGWWVKRTAAVTYRESVTQTKL